jgi:hypothetical protein
MEKLIEYLQELEARVQALENKEVQVIAPKRLDEEPIYWKCLRSLTHHTKGYSYREIKREGSEVTIGSDLIHEVYTYILRPTVYDEYLYDEIPVGRRFFKRV